MILIDSGWNPGGPCSTGGTEERTDVDEEGAISSLPRVQCEQDS